MDLVIVILFLVFYYLRPQEWYGIFASIHFVQVCMLIGLGGLFFRERGLRPRDLFRTPHDWAVFAFWLWMIFTSPHWWEGFKENANYFIFYIVIVQALYSIPRMKLFLGWWTLLIVAVALLALASKWGFDPLGSLDITNGKMRGRLVLNLSIFDNPNGLGHSVVPAIPMLYYYFIWKRPITSRLLGIGLLTIPLYCIYLTYSKGAFLCAAGTTFATMAIGRPKKVQIALAIVAFMFGSGLLFALPRMNELNKAKSDQAIQGRVASFKHGYQVLQNSLFGVGKGQWDKDPFITDYRAVLLAPRTKSQFDKGKVVMIPFHYNKAPHSSYVCIGAELGKPGLYLFLAVLYCCLRTTISARTQTPDEERIRRMLFVLVVSYIVSSWMVDFEYRPTFFMFAAAIAALHRHLLGLIGVEEKAKDQLVLEPGVPVWQMPELLPQPALAGLPQATSMARELVAQDNAEASTPEPESRAWTGIALNWNRFGLLDLLVIGIMTFAAVRFWAYIMGRM